MSQTGAGKLSERLGAVKRKSVNLSPQSIVKFDLLSPDRTLPLVATPALKGVNLVEWSKANQERIQALLLQHGALLFRNFDVTGPQEFEEFIRVNSRQLLEYRERSSPRSLVSGYVYTSTDHPADQNIFLHNENSYQQTWPMKIFFYCSVAAEEGGETPIADCRQIYNCIDPEVRERFREKQAMYVRNFGDGFGLSWQTVFQTEDRGEVEAQCVRSGLAVEWKEGNRLRTRAVRPAVAVHPVTRETVWFNHATFFHVSTLAPQTRAALQAEFADEDLPTNTFYGDGTPIEPDVLEHLRECYRRASVYFPWQKRDILMCDNMLVAHGRAPFKGRREILAGMAEPFSERGI